MANWQMCGLQYRRPGISQTTCLVSQYLSQWVNKKVSREFTQHIKCYTSNALCILLILWKQPSFKQTSETVIAKCRITQLVPGSWASNSKCPMPTRAETVSRHNEVMMPGRTKMLSTGHIINQYLKTFTLLVRLGCEWTHARFIMVLQCSHTVQFY